MPRSQWDAKMRGPSHDIFHAAPLSLLLILTTPFSIYIFLFLFAFLLCAYTLLYIIMGFKRVWNANFLFVDSSAILSPREIYAWCRGVYLQWHKEPRWIFFSVLWLLLFLVVLSLSLFLSMHFRSRTGIEILTNQKCRSRFLLQIANSRNWFLKLYV